jgi:hypothetical protein
MGAPRKTAASPIYYASALFAALEHLKGIGLHRFRFPEDIALSPRRMF